MDAFGGFHASWRGLLTKPSASYRYAPAGTYLENATNLFIPMASDVVHNAFGDLFVDESGRVHRPIATWTSRGSVTIDFSYKNLNGSFTTPTRPSIGDLVTKLDSNPSVAVAPTGHVFVSYRDFVGGNIVTYLSILDDGVWTKYVVDPACGTAYGQFYKTALTATAQGVYGLWRAANGTFMLGVGAVSAPSASVTVTSPNGMESWTSGSTRSISWTTDDISGTVDLQLFRNFALVGTIAQGVPSSSGSYAWTVGNYIGGLAPNGQGYRVRIRTSDGTYQDFSNCAFTIGAAVDPLVVVAVPNGGENSGPRHEPFRHLGGRELPGRRQHISGPERLAGRNDRRRGSPRPPKPIPGRSEIIRAARPRPGAAIGSASKRPTTRPWIRATPPSASSSKPRLSP